MEPKDKITLSNQARWYLNGIWPIYLSTFGHLDPEKTAIAELVRKGLAEEYSEGRMYTLTAEGRRLQNELRGKGD